MKKTTLNIGGMHCAACSSYLEKELSKNKSIENANVSIATNTATFEYDESVLSIKDIDKIVKAIKEEYSHSKKSAPQKAPKRRLKSIEVVLLILGSPIWLSLIIGAFCTVFSLWVTVWCVVISLWAVFASLVGGSIGGIVAGMIFIVTGKGFAGAIMIASALICAGLSIFAFWGSKLATKGTALLTKACAKAIKRIFTKKEKIQ